MKKSDKKQYLYICARFLLDYLDKCKCGETWVETEFGSFSCDVGYFLEGLKSFIGVVEK